MMTKLVGLVLAKRQPLFFLWLSTFLLSSDMRMSTQWDFLASTNVRILSPQEEKIDQVDHN